MNLYFPLLMRLHRSCPFFKRLSAPLVGLSNSVILCRTAKLSSRLVPVPTSLSRLAYNGEAAWRSGGFHYTFCGARNFKFTTTVVAGFLPPLRQTACCRQCICPHCYQFIVKTISLKSLTTPSGPLALIFVRNTLSPLFKEVKSSFCSVVKTAVSEVKRFSTP